MRAQLARVDAVLIQAVIAAALSFAHLHDIASAAGQDGWKAWAYPISVDLLLVAAWRRLRSGEAKAAGWCWFVIALTASLGANVATAGLLDMTHVPAWLRILVAGWPAVAFLGGTLLAHSAPTPLDQAADTAKDNEVQADEPELPPTQQAHLPVEQAPHQRPATEQEPPENPALPVPAALVAHARKVAAEHHTRTGAPIDTPTLRARLGVPAPMAEAIATHL
ncbi:SpdA protein [Streptomyces olindensis]|nr:SpdA protein [Streptomyces olindensis]